TGYSHGYDGPGKAVVGDRANRRPDAPGNLRRNVRPRPLWTSAAGRAVPRAMPARPGLVHPRRTPAPQARTDDPGWKSAGRNAGTGNRGPGRLSGRSPRIGALRSLLHGRHARGTAYRRFST